MFSPPLPPPPPWPMLMHHWISRIIIHQIFSLACDWSKPVTWPNIPQLKLWNIREYSPILKIARVAKKIWMIIKTIVSISGEKYVRIFVFGHYLSLVAHSFPRDSLSENCSPIGTDNLRLQITEYIFAPNGEYCWYTTRAVFKIFEKVLKIESCAGFIMEVMFKKVSFSRSRKHKLTKLSWLQNITSMRFLVSFEAILLK